MKRRNAAVVQAAFHATPVFVAKAEGAVVEDVDGNRLIDFAGGIGCLNTGHRAPAVVDAVRRNLIASCTPASTCCLTKATSRSARS
jgi:4-aminobutyrate aminotransferase / (S)-3-amino-2-methylpropionate transaminase / 5-aminovalerate transaminase